MAVINTQAELGEAITQAIIDDMTVQEKAAYNAMSTAEKSKMKDKWVLVAKVIIDHFVNKVDVINVEVDESGEQVGTGNIT